MSQDQPFQDPFEFLKKLWSPTGLPLAGMMPPLLNPGEIDKRIGDLKSVEAWLGMNLNMLRMTIQGLEMQKATLNAFQSMQAPSSAGGAPSPEMPPSNPMASSISDAAEAWWNLLQQQPSGNPAQTPDKKPK